MTKFLTAEKVLRATLGPLVGALKRLWNDSLMSQTLELVVQPVAADQGLQPELDLGLPPRLVTRRPRRSNGVSRAMQSVAEFHMSFMLPLETRPQRHVQPELAELRVELLREEFEEFRDAVEKNDLVSIADALGDIVYVAYGAALTYGVNLDAVLAEVHRANMSKLGSDGLPLLRDDGKVLKPETYVAPDVRRVLLDQPPLFLD